MTSELRVDKIHNEGGDNDSGIDLSTNDQIVLKTANTTRLTMNATGQTTIVGEGGSTTTSVQQGLAKHWIHHDDGATVRDSLNNSSLTDHAAGKHTNTFSNNFANIYYCYFGTVGPESYSSCQASENSTTPTTSAYRYGFPNHSNGTYYDNTNTMMATHGELA